MREDELEPTERVSAVFLDADRRGDSGCKFLETPDRICRVLLWIRCADRC
jgi:hypothetical protein